MAIGNNSALTSCRVGNPFIGLGDGHDAPILNYNLPQKTCYDVNTFFPVNVPAGYFNASFTRPPATHPWAIASNMSMEEIVNTLKSDIMGGKPPVLMLNAKILRKRKDLIRFLAETGIKYVVQDPKPEVYIAGDSNLRMAQVPGTGNLGGNSQYSPGRPAGGGTRINHLTAIPNLPAERIQVCGYTLAYIAAQVADGFIPELVSELGGRVVMKFRSMPTIQPRITIVEHSKMCSFLGDYGAGKTVKTFTLLPGERTTITVKSYKDKTSSFTKSSSTTTNEYTSTYYADDEASQSLKSENILDSYSQYSADQAQALVENQFSVAFGEAEEEHHDHQSNLGFGAQAGFQLFGVVDMGLSANVSVGSVKGGSSNSYRDEMLGVLSSSLESHVAESSAHRDVEVNTTTGNSSNHSQGGNAGSSTTMSVSQQESMMIKAGEETVTIRELQNINYSRVLNCVFRQLLQEYITVTWLNDASIVFTTGIPGQQRAVHLSQLEGFLEEVIDTPAHRDEVRKAILLHFCNVANYQGTVMPFAEKVTEVYTDCVDATSVPAIVYWRKRKNLSDSYSSGGLNITVPGVITGVKSYILRTDSVIVDALLGQGEALDCYNMRLQEESARSATLKNERYEKETSMEASKISAALAAIAAITDPVAQAEAYKKIFGTCCDFDRMGLKVGGCGCDSSSGTTGDPAAGN